MLQEGTRNICAVGIRGVSQPSREVLHALVVFTAQFGAWVLAASSGHLPVNMQSSGSSDLYLLHVLQRLELAGECSCGS